MEVSQPMGFLEETLLGRSWQLQDGWDMPQEPLLKVPRAVKEAKISWYYSKASPCICWKLKNFPLFLMG